jgi:glutamate/tyrosine decarboxylase-like PLP-dependent enzyme
MMVVKMAAQLVELKVGSRVGATAGTTELERVDKLAEKMATEWVD